MKMFDATLRDKPFSRRAGEGDGRRAKRAQVGLCHASCRNGAAEVGAVWNGRGFWPLPRPR